MIRVRWKKFADSFQTSLAFINFFIYLFCGFGESGKCKIYFILSICFSDKSNSSSKSTVVYLSKQINGYANESQIEEYIYLASSLLCFLSIYLFELAFLIDKLIRISCSYKTDNSINIYT
jgi:hypothetical protein